MPCLLRHDSHTFTLRARNIICLLKRTITIKSVDAYSHHEFQVVAAMKWLLMQFDTFPGVTFIFLLVFSMYFRDSINPAIAGLAVTYGLALNGSLCSTFTPYSTWRNMHFSGRDEN
ncbi:hypothetical protein AgCh_013063 [Apium graveolens]